MLRHRPLDLIQLLYENADADEPDTGVIKRKKGMTVGYLSQDPQLDER